MPLNAPVIDRYGYLMLKRDVDEQINTIDQYLDIYQKLSTTMIASAASLKISSLVQSKKNNIDTINKIEYLFNTVDVEVCCSQMWKYISDQ